jgi:DNA-binding FadR family transcriptional regulator
VLTGPATLVRNRKVPELIVAELRRLIVQEGKPGDFIPPERLLIEKFGVSRPTLREALRVLEAEGLVEIRRGTRGGAMIRKPAIDDMARIFGTYLQMEQTTIGDLYLARQVFEPAAARLAAANPDAGPALDEALAAEERLMAASGDEAVVGTLVDFHDTVLELSGSTTLTALGRLLAAVVAKDVMQALSFSQGQTTLGAAFISAPGPAARKKTFRAAHRSHQELADAIKAGDGDLAEGLMRTHLEGLWRRFSKSANANQVVDLFRTPESDGGSNNAGTG